MALSNEIYQALEDIVGKKNISKDPALLDTYRYSLTHTGIHLGPHYGVFTPRAVAVVLPGSTEEVQLVVKLCNKHKIKYKPSATFWSAQGYPSDDNTLILDMRRMDRILDIDEKNMIAIVEPGVIGATLQAEAMKVGLNVHIQGSGCSCSIIAGAAAWLGSGPSNLYGGWQYENLLAAEWVLPTGELLKNRFSRNRKRLVLRRRTRTEHAGHSPRDAWDKGVDGHIHQVRHQAVCLAGPGNIACLGNRPRL